MRIKIVGLLCAAEPDTHFLCIHILRISMYMLSRIFFLVVRTHGCFCFILLSPLYRFLYVHIRLNCIALTKYTSSLQQKYIKSFKCSAPIRFDWTKTIVFGIINKNKMLKHLFCFAIVVIIIFYAYNLRFYAALI